MFAGGSPKAEFVRLSLTQLRDRVLDDRADATVYDGALTQLEDPERWFPAFALVAAWGRVP